MNNIKQNLQSIYNNIAGEFSASRKYAGPELSVFIPYIQDNDKILDLGCGNGRLLNALKAANKTFDYLGVDFSPDLIKHAKTAHPDQKFIISDMSDLDLAGQSFDAVFVIATFHHLDTKKERIDLLKKINTWLAPGGFLFMTNWDLWQPKYLKDYFYNFWQKKSYKDFFVSWQMYSDTKGKFWRYYHSFSLKELKKLLTQAGFDLQPKSVYKTGHNIYCLAQKSRK